MDAPNRNSVGGLHYKGFVHAVSCEILLYIHMNEYVIHTEVVDYLFCSVRWNVVVETKMESI